MIKKERKEEEKKDEACTEKRKQGKLKEKIKILVKKNGCKKSNR